MIRKVFFPGSFDPFTIGHLALVNRTLALVDEVIVGVGINEAKNSLLPVDKRTAYIERVFEKEKRVRVVKYEGLTVDAARNEGAAFILRGLRNSNDFEFERDVAEINRMLEGIETILLFSEPALVHISSSMVRELYRFGRNIDTYIPIPLEGK